MRYIFATIILFILFAAPAAAQSRNQNWALCEAGDPVHGIEACTTLIQSGTETVNNIAIAHSNRGITYSDKGDFDRAIADYEQALKLNPNLTAAINSLAWDLATMPSADRRDGRRAVELAKRAQTSNAREPGFLDTLAAAYAESGRFADAVRAQENAIELLRRAGQAQAVIADFESRFRLYKSNRPFHRSR